MKTTLFFICFILFFSTSYAQYTARHVFICPGDTIHFRAQCLGSSSYTWYKDGHILSNQGDSVLDITDTGSYSVIARNMAGCESDISDAISVNYNGPVAKDDAASVDAGRKISIPILNNDDTMCTPFVSTTIQIGQYPSKGHLVINNDGAVDYVSHNEAGEDMFTYTVKDANGMVTNTATARIQINGGCSEIYPNPTVDDVYVNVINKNITDLRIMDMSGQIIFSTHIGIPGAKVMLSEYANGTYIIQLMEHGRVSCTYKVIKSKE